MARHPSNVSSSPGQATASPASWRRQRVVNLASRKPKLVLACLSVLAGAVLVALAAFVLVKTVWPRQRPLSNACSNHACREYTKRLLSSINTSVDPCESFTRFVCDGWQRNNQLGVWEEQFQQVLNQLTSALRVVDRTGGAVQSDEQRAAALYFSCDDVLRGNSDQLPDVKMALEGARIVWPQPSEHADLLYTLLYSSLKLGWDVLLDFAVIQSGDTVELVVSPGKSLQFVIHHHFRYNAEATKKAYFHLLRASFRRNNTAVVSYNETSACEEPAMTDLSGVYHTSDGHRFSDDTFKTSPEIGLTEDRWLATLSSINISLPRGFLISSVRPDYLITVLSLWRQQGEDAFHFFVSWCTVQVAALYANKDLILNFYDQNLKIAAVYHGAFCVSRAVYFSRSALFARYNAEVLRGNADAVARELTLTVRSAFHRRLTSWAHFDENVTVIDNWPSLETVFRRFEPEEVNKTTELGGRLPEMTDSFVNNWKLSVLIRNPAEVDHMLYSINRLHYYILSSTKRDFELMPYSLSFPVFDAELPASLNYGGLGADVATVLGHMFLYSYIESANTSQVESFIDCMRSGPFSDVENIWLYAARGSGISAVVDAYENSDRVLHHVLQGLEQYDGVKLMFMAMCYVMCEGSVPGDGESACNLYLQYAPEFAEAFQCPRGSPMNPSSRCELL